MVKMLFVNEKVGPDSIFTSIFLNTVSGLERTARQGHGELW